MFVGFVKSFVVGSDRRSLPAPHAAAAHPVSEATPLPAPTAPSMKSIASSSSADDAASHVSGSPPTSTSVHSLSPSTSLTISDPTANTLTLPSKPDHNSNNTNNNNNNSTLSAAAPAFLSHLLSPKHWLSKGSNSSGSTHASASPRHPSIYSSPSSSTTSLSSTPESSSYCAITSHQQQQQQQSLNSSLHLLSGSTSHIDQSTYSIDTVAVPPVLSTEVASGRFSPTGTQQSSSDVLISANSNSSKKSKLLNESNMTSYKSVLQTINNIPDSLDAQAIDRNTKSIAASSKVLGKLRVNIVEMRDLKVSTPDQATYIVCTYDSSEYITSATQTSSSANGASSNNFLNPGIAIPSRNKAYIQSSSSLSSSKTTGKHEVQFDVTTARAELDISIYDANTNQKFLGHVCIEPKLDTQSFLDQWFPLAPLNNKANAVSGEVRVQLSFERTRGNQRVGPNDFEVLRLVGKGTFGQVYQVRKHDTRRIYAMKILSKKIIVAKKEIAHTLGERDILVRTALTHSQFIVGLKFSFQTATDLYLVTDYMSGGELFWHLQKEGKFNETRAKFYIAELIIALDHLHESGIVYRDLKPENILLDANGHIALCDFGLSKANLSTDGTTNTFCGTTEYLAPEVLLDDAGYTKMVDFWSLGVLVFEMCCGWSPFYAEDTQKMYKNIAFGKVRFPKDSVSAEGRDFVKGLLNRNPHLRLGAHGGAQELKRHAFFREIDWTAMENKEVEPPFKPKLVTGDDTDTSNFDPEFTQASTSVLRRGLEGTATTPLSPGIQANFHGFTYVEDSVLVDGVPHNNNNDNNNNNNNEGKFHASHGTQEEKKLDNDNNNNNSEPGDGDATGPCEEEDDFMTGQQFEM
jgi:protein-serine/threonine kinase